MTWKRRAADLFLLSVGFVVGGQVMYFLDRILWGAGTSAIDINNTRLTVLMVAYAVVLVGYLLTVRMLGRTP